MLSGFEEWRIMSNGDMTQHRGQPYSQYYILVGSNQIPLYHLSYPLSQNITEQKINVIGEIFRQMEQARNEGKKFRIVDDLSDLLEGTSISLVGLSHNFPEIEISTLRKSLEAELSRS